MISPLSSLFDEATADAIVESNRAKYKRQLAIIKELEKMELIKKSDGMICKVVSMEEVTRADIMEHVNKKKAQLAHAMELLNKFNELESGLPVVDQSADQPAPEAPAQPVQDSAVNHEVVSQPEAPIEPAPAPTPETPVAPEAPVPETPAPTAPVDAPAPEPQTIIVQ